MKKSPWLKGSTSIFFALLTALLLAGTASYRAALAQSDGNLDSTIRHLIDDVSDSDLLFVRNGKTHSATEAAQHTAGKYHYFKGEIRTPEDFIRLCITKSAMTGRP